MRAVINMGAEGGNSEIMVENVEFGSSIIGPNKSNGMTAIIITGITRACVSFTSVTAAPIARKSEPYIKMAKIR